MANATAVWALILALVGIGLGIWALVVAYL